jgi:hypothetical protein
LAKIALRRATSRWRSLPDFLVIGVQKSGTSSLHEYLAQLPWTAPSRVKEIHFLDSDNYLKGENWYRSFFGLRWMNRGRKSFESTPSYLESAKARERLREFLPEARLVVVLRSPAERAHSHYSMAKRAGREQRSFDTALREEVVRRHSPLTETENDGTSESPIGERYQGRSLYADRLEALLSVELKNPVLVLFIESLVSDPVPSIRLLHAFLGLPEPSEAEFPWIAPHGPAAASAESADVLGELRKSFSAETSRLRVLLRTRGDALLTLPEAAWPEWMEGDSVRD